MDVAPHDENVFQRFGSQGAGCADLTDTQGGNADPTRYAAQIPTKRELIGQRRIGQEDKDTRHPGKAAALGPQLQGRSGAERIGQVRNRDTVAEGNRPVYRPVRRPTAVD